MFYVLWVVYDVEYNDHGNFTIWPQVQVKKGKKGKFWYSKFWIETYFSDSVLSQDSNDVFGFGIHI